MGQQTMVDVYVGTYTKDSGSEGIYLYRLDASSGQLSAEGCVGKTANPSFLTIDAGRRFIYAVNEKEFPSPTQGGVSAFSVDPATGKLTLVGQQPVGGDQPCHLSIDTSGRWLLVANYGGGNVSVLPIQQDGGIGPMTQTVQHAPAGGAAEAHAHCIVPASNGRHVLAVDLGLDAILRYELDGASGQLTQASPERVARPRGSEPRMLHLHPNGRFAYLMHEVTSTLTVYDYAADSATLSELQTISTLPEGWQGTSYCAEVQIAPSGRFVYAANRGHDSIAVFAVDPESGRLELLQHCPTEGHFPRHFTIDPSGNTLIVANQKGDSLAVLRVDPQSGRLSSTGQVLQLPQPVCVLMVKR